MDRRKDPTAWMWAEACDFIERAEKMHRQFFRLAASEAQAVWEPPVDVFETEHELVVVVALPGVRAADVEVRGEPGHLVVQARREPAADGPRQRIRQLEIPYGYFERRIALPAIALEAFSQELNHGCLVVRLRKAGQP
jgi:HSP20 family molecular chaperone IbpA